MKIKVGLALGALAIGVLLMAAGAMLPVVLNTVMPPQESVAIIGGADGPTAQYLTSQLFWHTPTGILCIVLMAGGGLLTVVGAVCGVIALVKKR